MADCSWYFPTDTQEVLSLMNEGFTPHAGGTWLMKNKPKKGFIDLSGIRALFGFEFLGDSIEVGAMLTFSELTRRIADRFERHLLASALKSAASNTLRNRITLGGSLASFPVWSDLAGALTALDAEVHLSGTKAGWYGVPDYLKDPSLRKGAFILGIRFPAEAAPFRYYRHVRTTFDYPAFTVSLLADRTAGIRGVVCGTGERISRYKAPDPENFIQTVTQSPPVIPGRFGSSGEYLSHCAAVELSRLAESLKEELP